MHLNSLNIWSEFGDDRLGALERKLNIGPETVCYLVPKFPSVYHNDYPLFLPRPTSNLLNTLWTRLVIKQIPLACQPFSKVLHLPSTKELGSGLKDTVHRHLSRVDWEQHRFAPTINVTRISKTRSELQIHLPSTFRLILYIYIKIILFFFAQQSETCYNLISLTLW